MQTPTSHVTELLNAGWLVPKELQSALADYLQTLTPEQKAKTIEQVDARLWADYEDDDIPGRQTTELQEGESIWLIDMDSVMWRSNYGRSYGAAYYADALDKAYADASCKGVVLRFGNGMGGERKASYMVADAVGRRNKPVYAYIEYGSAYSGHYLVACSCDGINCSNDTDSVGSIGAYISFVDYDAWDAKFGIVRKDVYAEASPDKNKSTREAKKGNFKLLEAQAQEIALEFQARVILARGGKLKSDTVLKGGEFSAPKALEQGLIDGIGNIDAVLKRVMKLSANFSNQTQNTDMFGFMKAPAVLALMGVAAGDITEEQLNAALTELQSAGGEGFIELMQSFGQPKATTVDVKASVEYKALEAKLTTATTKVGELTTKLEGYEKHGDEVTNPLKREEKIERTGNAGDELLSEADIQMRALWPKK
ncbi:S49 family peptidase [Runella sp.]|uniref:S49 family peptidase n=1 Tax=Runella sp. TaxID=1960881 RepID=UPI003D112D47